MITGMWERIKFVCGNHPGNDDIKSTIQDRGDSPFYSCPKYYPENREEGERPCYNRASTKSIEKFINYISEIIMEAELNDEDVNLKNRVFSIGGIEYKVLDQAGFNMKVSFVNRRALMLSKEQAEKLILAREG